MIVFVHGVPETGALWDRVREHVGAPSTALSLPGFGADRAGVRTKDEHVAWLVEQLHALDEPVDLVGHDWGSLLTYRVVTASDVPVRSWVADVGNVLHPDYVWHVMARTWQTPDRGEESLREALSAGPQVTAPAFASMGVPPDEAQRMASWLDVRMTQSILDLYRSATPNLHAQWGAQVGPTGAPGLVLHAAEDPFSDERMSADVARRLGAEHRVLPGLGHWWPLQAPRDVAGLLADFWARTG